MSKLPDGAMADRVPFSFIHGVPIYFNEDWKTGIGGGLWSTGLALSRYFNTGAAAASLQRLASQSRGLSILELGSGNGFLSVCLAALTCSQGIRIKNLVVTDMDDDHLSMIRETIEANRHATTTIGQITVAEHCWGEFAATSEEDVKYDLILGSDVAYRDFLYDPLIRSIRQFSHSNTVSLIGVTMTDTTPDFFHQLDANGLRYQKLADHLLDPELRGPTFGIFVIRKR